MKKRIFTAIAATILSLTMSTPAFAEIIWTPDKLPEGYTTNEWENKDFSFKSGGALKRDTWTGYMKDLHGNFMKNTVFAGGARTDENGVLICADGHVCSYGTELTEIEYFNTQPYEHEAWHQDASKPLNENGISNYWYGTTKGGCSMTCRWRWMGIAPDGKIENYTYSSGMTTCLLYAYCFDEYGYLYTNTITPDGYMVNELGQLMIDGKVKTHLPSDGNKYYGYADFPIGALGYDFASCERAAQIWGADDPYF